MQTRATLCLAATLLVAAPSLGATLFTADMDDTQEVAPGTPGTTTGTAAVDLQLNDLGGGSFSLTMQMLFTSDFNFVNFGGANSGSELVQNLHIHARARGASGAVVWGVFSPDQDTDNDTVLTSNPDGTTLITTEWDLNEGSVPLAAFVDDLQAAAPGADVNLYLNLHTSDAPGGAIRGQLVAVPEPATALLLLVGMGAAAIGRRRA
jgi:hypothetical protein